MIRFLAILFSCVGALAQSGVMFVTNATQLASLNPGGLTTAILINTNGGAVYGYYSAAIDPTNNTAPPSVLQPAGRNGRWIAVCLVPGTTIPGLQGAGAGNGADKVATNNGTAFGLTVQGAQTNAYVTPSKLATFDSAQRLTNSPFADSDFDVKANNLSDLSNKGTARTNLGVDDVDSIAALRTLNPANVKRYVIVGGYYSRQDGGGGVFYWDSASTLATNRGTCFQDGVPDATGRWHRVYDRLHTRFNAKWFGAKGDGTTDDTASIADMIASLQPNMELEIGGGFSGDTYSITALTIAKNNFTIRGKGTLKFSATNLTGIVITGTGWTWDGPGIDGNSVSSAGLFVNNGCKDFKIKNAFLKNFYGDQAGVIAGIFVHKACQIGTISDVTISNVTHLSTSGRVSRAIQLTDGGTTTSADYIQGITISGCKFYNIAPGAEGDCVAMNTDRFYSIGLLVSNCEGYNYGQRFGKVEGGGTKWSHNWAESYSVNPGGSMTYSGFSFYGPTNICNNNTILGNNSIGIEFGVYTPTYEAYNGQANDNLIIFNGANSASLGIGLDFKQRAYNMQGSGNIVYGGQYAARLIGDARNVQLGLTLATNQVSAGIITLSDGTNAPSNCDLGNLKIEAPAATYGFDIFAGANINSGTVHGTTATALMFRTVGVTGNQGAEIDSQNAVQNRGVMFGPLLTLKNAPFSVSGSDASFDGLVQAKSFIPATANKGANYTITAADYGIFVTATATMTLPAANSFLTGQAVRIKSASGVTTTVAKTGSDTIDQAAASDTLTTLQAAIYVSDGVSNWRKFPFNSGGGGSAPTGTMVSSGSFSVGDIPAASDTTGTNFLKSKVALTQPATAATITVANNKTLAVNNSITLAGTDGTTITMPASTASVLSTASAEINALTLKATPVSGDLLVIEDSAASNAKKKITVGSLPSSGGGSAPAGTMVSSGSFAVGDIPAASDTTGTNFVKSKVTLTQPATAATITVANNKTLAVNNSITFAGTDSTTITMPASSATVFSTASGEYNALTSKPKPTSSDLMPIEDAAASNAKKKVAIGTLPVMQRLSARHWRMAQPIHGGDLSAMGMGIFISGTSSTITPTATEPVMINYASAATTGSIAGTHNNGNVITRTGRNIYFAARVKLQETAATRVWIGLFNQGVSTVLGADTNPDFMGFRFSTVTADTNWKACNGLVSQTTTDSGVAADTTIHLFEIVCDDSVPNIKFYIDGALVATNTTNLPSADVLQVVIGEATQANVTKNIRVGWIYVEDDL